MRWFWGFLALATIATVVLLTMRGGSAPAVTAPAPEPTPPAAPPPIPSAPTPDSVRPIPTPSPTSGAPITPTDPAAPTPTVASAPKPKPVPAPKPEPSPAPPAPPAPSAADPMQFVGPPLPTAAAALALKLSLDDMLGLTDPSERKHKPAVPEVDQPKPAAGASTPPAAAAKAKLTSRDDGTTLVDDRFVIKGAGSHEDPYIISWEMLVSAQETYQPRLGRKNIPDRLKMMDGKWIRIPGYIAFPLMAQSQDEMLMMLNQWDGCCIGVPPTPYDAIEVKLKNPAKGEDRLRVSGAITGILRVDPYLVKDWLVSLYLMDDGELKVETSGPKRDPLATPGHEPPQ